MSSAVNTDVFQDAIEEGLTNHPTLWGRPVNPLGEISGVEYLLLANGDQTELRRRYIGMTSEAVITIAFMLAFMHTTYYSICTIYRNPSSFPGWCCFIQAGTGVVSFGIGTASYLTTYLSCRVGVMVVMFGLSISMICVTSLLARKAYLCHSRDWRIALFAGVFMLAIPVVLWASWTHTQCTHTPDNFCSVIYPDYIPWLFFGLEAPINIVLTILFMIVIIRQYRRHGTAAWALLRRDGFLYILSVVTINLICLAVGAGRLWGENSQVAYPFDWLVTSFILAYQAWHIRH